ERARRPVRRQEEVWASAGVCADLDRLLATGRFVGIGEGSPCMPPRNPREPVDEVTATRNMLAIMDVASRHKVPVQLHTGCPMGYGPTTLSTGPLGAFNFKHLR